MNKSFINLMGKYTILEVDGDLTFDEILFKTILFQLQKEDQNTLVIKFHENVILNSHLIGILLHVNHIKNLKLILKKDTNLYKEFDMIKVNSVLQIFDSEEDFFKQISAL
jgi:hypothetical protein